ncbi:sensor histidine kinase [Phenylobacterium montanum]|uniref:histidine kinase n=1 Tax=Phenylobacterium montanum TaxID=2823693 RepID=A0A975FWM1_9CAUL|nr:HAMP domain-containing sensor histidine kinase [Caulobacter sp. S6]QUD86496.1 HAMP domain-containing histidine kinase [Caulobacter sp. S6]
MADASASAPIEPNVPEAGAPQGAPEAAAPARRTDQTAGQDFRRRARRLFWPGGLSSRLLILTILFVALAGLLILPSSMAQFEERWLEDRVRAAELASLAVDAAPNQVVSDKLSNQLLEGAGVVSVAVQSDGVRRLMLAGPRMNRTPYLVDLRRGESLDSLVAPFRTLLGGDRMVRVVDRPRFRSGDFVEIVAPDGPLRHELQAYLLRLLAVAAIISAVAGGLVYLSLNALLVRPMQRITKSMERFRADPEDLAAGLNPSGRRDEIGRAEAELDRMQADLRAALNSRARLAALGEAVAKINHDLRNMLTSAQIASERLAQSGDPKVAQAMPRLERALDRAVTLASNVLAYGKSEEAAPSLDTLWLAPAVEAAAEDAGLTPEGVRLDLKIAPQARVSADPEQLHRILVNLLRNGRQAIAGQEGGVGAGAIAVSLEQANGVSLIRIADDGPGVPERVMARLFQPFAASANPGGAGLGLAISRELAQGHGGDLTLARTGPEGSVFELKLPGAPPPAPRPAR